MMASFFYCRPSLLLMAALLVFTAAAPVKHNRASYYVSKNEKCDDDDHRIESKKECDKAGKFLDEGDTAKSVKKKCPMKGCFVKGKNKKRRLIWNKKAKKGKKKCKAICVRSEDTEMESTPTDPTSTTDPKTPTDTDTETRTDDPGEPVGGCVRHAFEELVPGDELLFTVSNIVKDSSCNPFKEYISAFGVLLVGSTAGQNVPDRGLKWLATALTEMFPGAAADPSAQRAVIQAMYRHRAANPVFVGKPVHDGSALEPAVDHISICDTITIKMEGEGGEIISPAEQLFEVIEHLLHIVTNVGLSNAYPQGWGLTESSDLYKALKEAKQAGVYDDSYLSHIPEDHVRVRITLQEFGYWALVTSWGVFRDHFPGTAHPEWTITTPAEVQQKLPKFWKLHQATTAKVMAPPTEVTIEALGKLAPGHDAGDPAWPPVDPGRGSLGGPKPDRPCRPAK